MDQPEALKKKRQRRTAPRLFPSKYLSDHAVADRLQVSRDTVWRWVRAGKFPPPIKLADNVTRWKVSTVEAWEADREAAA